MNTSEQSLQASIWDKAKLQTKERRFATAEPKQRRFQTASP
jgi:hypothetical protein